MTPATNQRGAAFCTLHSLKEEHGLNTLDTPSQHVANTQVATDITLRRPCLQDGASIQQLIQASPPLDVNSTYAYMLLCQHFRDTCVVATRQSGLAGFISAYIPPAQPDVLFVWQVVVHADARGQRLAGKMLNDLLAREQTAGVRFIETTVSPSNLASRRVFAALARDRNAELAEQDLFTPEMFGGADHEAERLLRIGPF